MQWIPPMRQGYFITTFSCLLLDGDRRKAKGLLILNGLSSHQVSPPSPFKSCLAFSLPPLPLLSFILPIDRWMCDKPLLLNIWNAWGASGPHSQRLLYGGRAGPRKLHLMSTVGGSVSGMRTTLEEALLKILKDRRPSLSLKSPRFGGSRQAL